MAQHMFGQTLHKFCAGVFFVPFDIWNLLFNIFPKGQYGAYSDVKVGAPPYDTIFSHGVGVV